MNISGILVVAKPELFSEVIEAISKKEGIEVHQTDPESGKIVITQEAETIRAEADQAESLKDIPGVICVNLVYHYFGEDPTLKYPAEEEASSPTA